MAAEFHAPVTSSSSLDEESSRRWFLFLLLALALLYSPLMLADYAWDDEALVLARQTALAEGEAAGSHGDLWMSAGSEAQTSGYYRPAFLWSLDLDQQLWPGSPGGAHMQSLAWHGAAVLALFLLLVQVVPGSAALLGAALFAFHPAQSEAVAWIAARNDLMVAALGIGGIAVLLPERPEPRRLVLGGALLLGAFLSKESAMALPVLLLGLDCARWGRPRGGARLGALAAPLLIYLVLRLSADVPMPNSTLPSLADASNVLVHYLSLVGFPRPLSVGRTLAELVWSPQAIGTAAVVGLGMLWTLRRGGALAAVGLVFGGLAFAPVLASLAAYGQLGDRFIYLPLAGISLAFAAGLPRSISSRSGALALVTLGLTGFLLVSERLPDWRDSEQLWTAEVARVGTTYAHANLANVLHRQGRASAASAHYLRALEGPGARLDRCGDAIRSALELGVPELGLDLIDRAYAASCPRTARREGVRALLLVSLGRLDEAAVVAKANPADPVGRTQLVLALAAQRAGRTAEVDEIAKAYTARGVPRAVFEGMLTALGRAAPVPAKIPEGAPPASEPEAAP
jgi:hypothetical protein